MKQLLIQPMPVKPMPVKPTSTTKRQKTKRQNQRTSQDATARCDTMRHRQRVKLSLLGLLLCAVCAGCADLPRDQHGATGRIREKGVLIVGVSRDDKPSALQAREKRLVEKIARRLGARVQWRRGNAHQLLQDLEELKLPIVAAEISSDSPFGEAVGMSQPYMKDGPHHKDYCLAVAPGENHLLFLIDRIILEEQKESGS